MISHTLNNKAIELAQKSLQKSFDWQAFLVLSMANLNKNNIPQENSDILPETQIDDNILCFYNNFISYYNNKKNNAHTLNELSQLISLLQKIINELYYTCNTLEEKNRLKAMVSTLFEELI